MDNAKSQLIDRLKSANSVLVTVSRNPSVDQLAACIGLTLFINKLGKHGSAVFSGEVPSTIEFLKPEDTFEKNADSLRDFIIALDKNKADKLRYKVEDQMVKIFITPYKTSLSEKDLEFSQGDFNVELVIALGVTKQEDLDEAIMAHGRILHDATVACINTKEASNLGTISWQEPTASSLCELVTDLASMVADDKLDEQISTALLTGIIAETHRFSNEKTSSQTMSVSAKLMAAGANQQLVATNLSDVSKEAPAKAVDQPADAKPKQSADGTLNIKHDDEEPTVTTQPIPKDLPELEPAPQLESQPGPQITNVMRSNQAEESPDLPKVVSESPSFGGTLTANSAPEQYDPATDPLSSSMLQSQEPPLSVSARPIIEPPLPSLDLQALATPPPLPSPTSDAQPAQSPYTLPASPAQSTYTPPPPTWAVPPPPPEPPVSDEPLKSKTLDELEEAVNSPHLSDIDKPDVDSARDQVQAILESSTETTEPKAEQATNAMPLGAPLHEDEEKEQAKAADNALSEIEQIHKSTGLDPSLFSDPPPKDDDKAPTVPPPILYPIKPTKDEDK
jgi:hypothetical protein